MKLAAAQALTMGYGEIYEGYSGRGMYGNQTTGVEYESMSEFFSSIANVMEGGDEEESEAVAEALHDMSFDSMGLGVIVY